MIDRHDISGLVLAGGRGRRMGGADKGLARWSTPDPGGTPRPLALNAVERLAPQVGRVIVSANRHLDVYRTFGATVVADRPGEGEFAGPLAGVRAGLERCRTRYLAVVPCDAPRFPRDLVARLAASLDAARARIAVAATCDAVQPVFMLLEAALASALDDFLRAGGRSARDFAAAHGAACAAFDDAAAFADADTADALARLAR